jgi:DNA modification methylase
MSVTVHHGDCLDILRELPDASVDSVCTDPPYNLSFMGRAWDSHETPVAFQAWCALWAAECLRVLKPGGHLLAFGGTRTWHRLACAVEDAGFEVRDSIAWLYGSGFPKSLDVSKAIERNKTTGNHGIVVKGCAWIADLLDREGISKRALDDLAGTSDMGGWWASRLPHRCALPTAEQWDRLWPVLGDPPEWLAGFILPANEPGEAWAQREVVGEKAYTSPRAHMGASTFADGYDATRTRLVDTAPATDAARTWQGWGTALKPAFEPIVVARKPLVGTVATNVLTYGTGALNVDDCRIETDEDRSRPPRTPNAILGGGKGTNLTASESNPAGRWPANVVLDETQADALDQQSGELTSGANPTRRGADGERTTFGDFAGQEDANPQRGVDIGGASRFFYVAKADTTERPFFFRPTCECEDSWPTTSPARATTEATSPAASSTSKSGNDTTGDQSPRAIRSTTSTTTNSTTTPATSSPSPLPTTSASTQAANSATENGGSPAGSAWRSSESVPLTGTSALRVGRSMDDAAPVTSRAWSKTSVCGSCAAPTRREAHATVKPLALMRWLVRLVTPPGGTVLEPFAGSGTTVEACILEGFSCIAIEREADYLPLIQQRINRRRDPVAAVKATGDDGGLFDLLDGGAA